ASQRKLQEIRRRFARPPGQSILLWLYGCWCAGADEDTLLDSSEAKQLGSLAWDVAIDRGIGRKTGIHTLWMRLVSSVREAYTADQLLVYRDRWNTKLEGVQYLTELTMADILFGNTQRDQSLCSPHRAYCTWHVWQELTRSAPRLCAKELSSIPWKRDLDELQACVWDCTLTPSSLPQHSLSYVQIQPKEYAASSGDPCTICHEELSRNSCELGCGHEFHRECIRRWLQEHSSTCPICRDYAVLPAHVPGRPAWNNSKHHKAKPRKRSGF
ncbi:DZIP3 ligase, partial [Illadopsis cleaveri]|nr:DZIP3 ligase [Illadopsis cleaveri]